MDGCYGPIYLKLGCITLTKTLNLALTPDCCVTKTTSSEMHISYSGRKVRNQTIRPAGTLVVLLVER